MSEEKVTVKPDIKELYKARQNELSGILKAKLSAFHNTTQGDHDEDSWIDFLRKILPNRYSVSKGFVFDYRGECSEQIDVIIYDELYSAVAFETSCHEKFVAVESVYAIFECKSVVKKGEFECANEKIQSVKNLLRTSRGTISSGSYASKREPFEILGGILGRTSGVTIETAKEHLLANANVDFAYFPLDNLSPKVTNACLFKNTSSKNVKISPDENSAMFFIHHLVNELYNLGTCPAIDTRFYAKYILDIDSDFGKKNDIDKIPKHIKELYLKEEAELEEELSKSIKVKKIVLIII